MPTYNAAAVADSKIAFQKGITLQQGRALRDNPLAVAEGSAGAAINATGWHPYNAVTVGDGNDGKFYDFAVDGAVTSRVTPDFVNGYEYRIILDQISNTGISDYTVRWYLELAAGYSGTRNLILTLGGSARASGMIEISNPRFLSCNFPARSSVAEATNGNLSTADVGITRSSADRILRAEIQMTNNTDAGKMFLHRRRVYGPAF